MEGDQSSARAMGTGDSSRERQAQTRSRADRMHAAAKRTARTRARELTFPGRGFTPAMRHGGAVELGADGDGAAIAVLRGVVEEVGDDA